MSKLTTPRMSAQTSEGAENVSTPWAERVQKAYDAWSHGTHLAGRFRMDRALKVAGVRGLIVARDEALAENANLRALVYSAWQELVRHGETPLTHDLHKAAGMTGSTHRQEER